MTGSLERMQQSETNWQPGRLCLSIQRALGGELAVYNVSEYYSIWSLVRSHPPTNPEHQQVDTSHTLERTHFGEYTTAEYG
jgi:hypothetical protein